MEVKIEFKESINQLKESFSLLEKIDLKYPIDINLEENSGCYVRIKDDRGLDLRIDDDREIVELVYQCEGCRQSFVGEDIRDEADFIQQCCKDTYKRLSKRKMDKNIIM